MPPFRPYACAEATGPLAALCDLDPSGTPTGAAAGGIDWDAPVTVTTGQAVGGAGVGAAAIAAAVAAGRRSGLEEGQAQRDIALKDALACSADQILCIDADDSKLDPATTEGLSGTQLDQTQDLNEKKEAVRQAIRDAQESAADMNQRLMQPAERKHTARIMTEHGDDPSIKGILDSMISQNMDMHNEHARNKIIHSAYCIQHPIFCMSDSDIETIEAITPEQKQLLKNTITEHRNHSADFTEWANSRSSHDRLMTHFDKDKTHDIHDKIGNVMRRHESRLRKAGFIG
jgi:hypothetical protein